MVESRRRHGHTGAFARINRFDVLNLLFEEVIIPQSVILELGRAEIRISGLKHKLARLTREELVALKDTDTRLGMGERECLVIAKQRGVPLASNDKTVHALARMAAWITSRCRGF
jgi:predicted nucleic acid-binding protein